jgi:hypothetical protein
MAGRLTGALRQGAGGQACDTGFLSLVRSGRLKNDSTWAALYVQQALA